MLFLFAFGDLHSCFEHVSALKALPIYRGFFEGISHVFPFEEVLLEVEPFFPLSDLIRRSIFSP